MIDQSLNEVETTAVKAARGGGFAWGLAEEIGRAARHIARGGGNWGEALVTLLSRMEGLQPPDRARIDRWRNGVDDAMGASPLCPVRTATALLDHRVFADLPTLRISNVALPLWLGAILAPASIIAEHAGDGLAESADVVLRHATRATPAAGRRGAIDPDTLAKLNAYAVRTYVPESERSRTRGAGGGRVDDE